MSSKIKIGDVVFEVPEGSSAAASDAGAAPPQASKPETPEPLEEMPYIYRPNDAFQSAVDEARAIASISAGHQPWVIKTWFVLFVLGPLFYAQCFVLAYAQNRQGWYWGRTVATLNLLILPLWSLYYSIWMRRMKKEVGPVKLAVLIASLLVCGAILLFAPEASPPAAGTDDAAGVAQVRGEGADLRKIHKVNFYLFFSTQSGAQWAAGRLEDAGFGVTVGLSEGPDPYWQVLATRQMLLDTAELVRIRQDMTGLANAAGGMYDGWETEAVR